MSSNTFDIELDPDYQDGLKLSEKIAIREGLSTAYGPDWAFIPMQECLFTAAARPEYMDQAIADLGSEASFIDRMNHATTFVSPKVVKRLLEKWWKNPAKHYRDENALILRETRKMASFLESKLRASMPH